MSSAPDLSPTTFEQAMSFITAGIAALKTHGPKDEIELQRMRAQWVILTTRVTIYELEILK